MTILAGDVKLVASQVMLDVDEGGGAPTATVITDGTSNSVFPDISELDRAGGRVNLRKAFAHIQTTNTDGYFGANVIVADPPDDPRVSVTLFATGDAFDVRSSARSRIESYLSIGVVAAPYLFGNHVAGQRTLTLLARLGTAVPVIGQTIALRKGEGTAGEVTQYVRVTDVSSFKRTFTYNEQTSFDRLQITLDISDSLRADFPGFDAAIYADYSINFTGKTKVYETIVADAARYYGVVPLTEAAHVGDFTVKGQGIFTQLVPSAQIETPIADARTNQQSAGLVESGSSLIQNLSHAFTTTASMYVGGGILPNTLFVSRSGITLVDKGGKLLDQSDMAQVGTVDYVNGILNLTTNIFGTGAGVHAVTFTPAEAPTVVTRSIGIDVEQATQRLSYVLTMDPPPLPGSVVIDYRSGGRWYTLTDDGSGQVKGAETSLGAGTLNPATGTLTVTLGALPDIATKVIVGWAPAGSSTKIATVATNASTLDNRFFTTIVLADSIKPNSLTLTWNDGTARTASDNGSGALTGYAIGEVDYAAGIVRMSPTTLPPVGTSITVDIVNAAPTSGAFASFTDGGSTWNFTLAGATQAKTVEMAIVVSHTVRSYPNSDTVTERVLRVFDDGVGNLQVANITGNLTVGTINYASGACTLSKSVGGFQDVQTSWVQRGFINGDISQVRWVSTGPYTASLNLTIRNAPSGTVANPSWAWWGASFSVAAQVRRSGAVGVSFNGTHVVDHLFAKGRASRFTFDGENYVVRDTQLQKNFSPVTGIGTLVGAAMNYSNGYWGHADSSVSGWSPVGGLRLDTWAASASPLISAVAGLVSTPFAGPNTTQIVDAITFRSAISPLRNGSFSIVGTTPTGVSINATADTSGNISTAQVTGTVNYETGVVSLEFPAGALADGLRYNATAYTYLPLNAELLGLDPVRLPQDGRVPIFRAGEFAVLGHTGTITATVSNGQVVNCARARLSRVRVIGNNGLVINTGYTTNLDAGTVEFTNVSGYSQPVTVEHRIEDMAQIRDAQISGQLTFTRPLTHEYPVGSYISSALVAGDLQSRVSVTFDQNSWDGVSWSNAVVGSAAGASFNDVLAPIAVSNTGAITERWAIKFTSSTGFQVVGENVGIIGTGSTSADCSMLNPATGVPYFTIPATGWGIGWSAGNVLRFNTIGSMFPFWIVRTIQQGSETVMSDSFTVLVRGDVDRA